MKDKWGIEVSCINCKWRKLLCLFCFKKYMFEPSDTALKRRLLEKLDEIYDLKEQVNAQKAYLFWCKDTNSVPTEVYHPERFLRKEGNDEG